MEREQEGEADGAVCWVSLCARPFSRRVGYDGAEDGSDGEAGGQVVFVGGVARVSAENGREAGGRVRAMRAAKFALCSQRESERIFESFSRRV